METITDKDIYNNVKKNLFNEMALSSDDIEVDVDKGKVTLMGMVDVLAEKYKAEEVVKSSIGVKAIDNSITIAMDNMLTDKEITDLVMERLEQYKRLSKISAVSKGGTVTLHGNASCSAEAEKAIEVAATVQSVKGVQCQIKIAQEEEIDDATITNAIERAFSLSENVSPRLVNTKTENGLVILSGVVPTEEEKKEAYKIASNIKGVKKVQNKVIIENRKEEDLVH